MFFRFLGITGIVFLSVVGVLADEPQRISMSMSGEHTINLKAQRLRVVIPLFSHALSSDEAIEGLSMRKEEARERCLQLNADRDSIQFGGVFVDSNDIAGNNQFALIQRMNAMGNQVDLEELPKVVTARIDLVCDWVLPDTEEEGLLGFAETISQSLREPDITGKEDRPEFSPRVEEALKQLRGQTTVFSSQSNRQDPDAIRYVFVAKYSKDDMRQAVQGATLEAQTRADAISEAMDFTTLTLLSMSTSIGNRYSSNSYINSGGRNRKDLLLPRDNEVTNPIAGELTYSVQVQMQYSGTK